MKKDVPVMVILGNPPYSGHSANKGKWVHDLMRGQGEHRGQSSYFLCDGQPLGEKNPKWLNDDYVKFIRFAQWRIERTGYGILAFVSNHGYLDNPTFRGMRQSLIGAFDDIYLLDLHGNAKKKETAPDGGPDENVFDIQQGVSIGIFVKRGAHEKRVFHADLYGKREEKYEYLAAEDVTTTKWSALAPNAPFYLFVPQNDALRQEYEQGWKLTHVFPVSVLGFQSHRDHFAVAFDRKVVLNRLRDLISSSTTDAEIRARYRLVDTRDWKLTVARSSLRLNANWQASVVRCAYRPLDFRWCCLSRDAMDCPRTEIIGHLRSCDNLALNVTRQTKANSWAHAMVADCPSPALFVEVKDGSTVFPLWLYGQTPYSTRIARSNLHQRNAFLPDPNVTTEFALAVEQRLNLPFHPNRMGRGARGGVTAFDILCYVYALLHSPTYRTRYAEFLKIDFPRIPLTSNRDLWNALVPLGERLVALHTMKVTADNPPRFPVPGDDKVEKVQYVPATGPAPATAASHAGTAPSGPLPAEPGERGRVESDVTSLAAQVPGGRVYINRTQYFEPVPQEVWEHRIGGYQPCEKWLKDRKGRTLTFEDLQHYAAIVANLRETRGIMQQIDQVIASHGGWPIR